MRRAVPARDVVNLSAAARVGPLGSQCLRAGQGWALVCSDGDGRALLLIADIGGYTEYMQFHRSVLGHAEAATARMLGKVGKVGVARDFELIEIEIDAAFLSRNAAGLDGPSTLGVVTKAAFAMRDAVHRERQLVQLNMCPCGSCKQCSALKLKFFSHVGEVATQTIKRRKKLVGLNVIHVHRMLKNPVDVPESLLVTDEFFRLDDTASSELMMQDLDLDLEGIGQVRTHYVDVGNLAIPPPRLSWPQRIGGPFTMAGRGIPYAVGRRRPLAIASTR